MNAGDRQTDISLRAASPASLKEQGLELAVFLLLIIPSMVLSFLAIKQGSVSFWVTAYATIARDLALVSLVAFFLWRNREPYQSIGWDLRGGWKEAALGVVLFIPMVIATGYVDSFFRAAGLSEPSAPTPAFLSVTGTGELVLASILVVVVAISEETIFRGYLMLRIGAVTRSMAAAAVLSAFVFSLGHGYEGTAGAATVGVMGFMLALVYLWRRSLIAPIIMHFLQDFIGIVLVPLLTGKS